MKSVSQPQPTLERRVFFVLASVALIYAFLAGLRTVADYDTGWQLATGRWVVQHHQIPSTDVLSYTMQGQHWIYPVEAGVLFYFVFLLGGYPLLSWLAAAACAGTVWLLIRRGSAISAGIAILGVPLIAIRITPRADMFSVLLFAAFLSLLWENYQTGQARLWWLPLLMLVWVNVHFGFVAGLALIVAYVGIEVLQMLRGQERRWTGLERLRRASGWLLATALVTLVNPWGWGIYRALLMQTRAAGHQEILIAEWASIPLNWSAVSAAFSLRQTPGTVYLLLAIAVVAAVVALVRAQFGAAILLLASTYPPVRHVRMGAVFACVVVVVGGSVLSEAINRLASPAPSRARPSRAGQMVAAAAVVLLAMLAFVRCFDLVTNRFYFAGDTTNSTFGAGLSWWFPERAVEFIQRQQPPGEMFNSYDAGGYLAWALGPTRRVYIDGRDTLFGVARIQRQRQLLDSPPDSDLWKEEADRNGINTVILSIGRYDGIQDVRLKDFCNSQVWSPVYLDEVAAVFVRRQPQTEDLIRRSKVDCTTAPLPACPPAAGGAEAFNQWANAAAVLEALDRNVDALAAADQAIALVPNSAIVHMVRAGVLYNLGRFPEAEEEYKTTITLHPDTFTWAALANFYRKQGRDNDAIEALKKAAELQARPAQLLVQLGYYSLHLGRPKDALEAFDRAAKEATPEITKATGRGSFNYNVATGRAQACEMLGNIDQAVAYQEEAVRLAPDASQAWLNLAEMYHIDGRPSDADRAKARAAAITESH